MKKNSWIANGAVVLGFLVATCAVAQVNNSNNSLPPIPPPGPTTVAPITPAVQMTPPTQTGSTNAPVKKTVAKPHHPKKHPAKKAAVKVKPHASDLLTTNAPAAAVTLIAGPATVAAEHVNVRGQAGLRGEVVTHLKKGDTVKVVEEITLDKPKTDEPAQWAKISLPADTKVWVSGQFVDSTTKTVKARKLNLRGGPGENYSVLGMIESGTVITPVKDKDGWLQIEAPASAYAFVAANLLTQTNAPVEPAAPPVVAEVPAPAVQPTVIPATPLVPSTPAPTVNTLAETPAVVPAVPAAETNVKANAVSPASAPATPPALTNAIAGVIASENLAAAAASTNATLVDTNPPPRIVTHEGVVRSVSSIIAPTYYELDAPDTGKTINYLYTTSTNLNLAHYNKLHIIVTGEETLAARWKDAPVLTIQRIQVVNPPDDLKQVKTN